MGWAVWAKSRGPPSAWGPRVPGKNLKKNNNFPVPYIVDMRLRPLSRVAIWWSEVPWTEPSPNPKWHNDSLVADPEDRVRGEGVMGVWDAVDTSPDLGGSQNVFKNFEMAIRHDGQPTRTELEIVFCRWIYFHLRSEIFFWPSYGGQSPPPHRPHGSATTQSSVHPFLLVARVHLRETGSFSVFLSWRQCDSL